MRPSATHTRALLGLCLFALGNGVAAAAGSISVTDGFAALPSCAQKCFVTAISNSTCALTDAACLCSDANFNNAATACITSACTVKESLTTKNVTSLMCGVEPQRDNSLVPLYSVFLGLAGLAMILRGVARVLTHAYFWWDDLANLFGFIGSATFTGMNIKAIDIGQSLDIWFVPFDNITSVLRLFYIEMLLYTITRFFVRASIILFYMRVFPAKDNKRLGRAVQYTMIFNVVYNLSFLVAVIFQCTPISYFWTSWEGEHEGHCGNANILVWVAAGTGIVYDLWLLALPFSQLWVLNLHWKKKLMGGMMFFVGVAVMIISLIRLKTINEFTFTVNPTKDIVQVCLWSGLELDVGVICPCLPSFRLLLRRLLPRVLGTSGRYELDPVSNASGVTRSGLRRSLGGNIPTPLGGNYGAAVGGGNNDTKGRGGGGAGGGIVVENTVNVKYGSGLSSGGAGSFESVKGLVDGRAPSYGEDEERWPGGGGGYPGYGRAR